MLAERTMPARLLALVPPGGLSAVIAETYTNGFHGLIAAVEAARPEVVVVGYIKGEGLDPIETWREENFEHRRLGPWRLYVRQRVPAGPGGASRG